MAIQIKIVEKTMYRLFHDTEYELYVVTSLGIDPLTRPAPPEVQMGTFKDIESAQKYFDGIVKS